MDRKSCGVCGKGLAGEQELYCPDCKAAIRRQRRKGRLYFVTATVIFLFAGLIFLHGENDAWEFSWDSLLRKPVAMVNGEPITWPEASERVKITRRMMEKEFGKDLFVGEKGRAYLRDIEHDVLERMISELLVAQEARRLNIKVSDERVKKEMQEIGREIYGNWGNFRASLKEDGISQEYLSAHVRNLLLCQEIKRAQAPAGVDPDEYFSAWLTQDRRIASVTFNDNF